MPKRNIPESAGATSARPLGAAVGAAGVTFRRWAPDHARGGVAIAARDSSRRLLPLEAESEGFFSGSDPDGRAGDTYRYVLEGQEPLPDVASRFQPEGVFGPSAGVDPLAYAWRHPGWRRPAFHGRVVYELHVGAFTSGGTFRAAIGQLEHLVALGVDTIELMPVADFPGRWNWGYDGVMPFAPARCYGTPDDFRALVDAAHGRGLAVVLDVVYNHPGPAGNHFTRYAAAYFNAAADTPWGASWNLDGDRSGPVREFFRQNAACWLDEFRLDGLRLDATHAIADRSPRHLCAEIADLAHARGAFVIAEDERNAAAVVAAEAPSDWGFDAVWADDFHHSIRVALTGQRESYFGSFEGTPEECADILNHGWKYRGQHFPHWGRRRGSPSQRIPPEKFVVCLSNHDQVGNRPLGDRLPQGFSAAAARAAAMLLCLCPYTPMLFMGQEWSAATPFLFFTDHEPELGGKIDAGRRRNSRPPMRRAAARPGEFPPAPGGSHLPRLEAAVDRKRRAGPPADAGAAHRLPAAAPGRTHLPQSRPRVLVGPGARRRGGAALDGRKRRRGLAFARRPRARGLLDRRPRAPSIGCGFPGFSRRDARARLEDRPLQPRAPVWRVDPRPHHPLPRRRFSRGDRLAPA